MATRRVIKSVLGNFLGTYTSRYSDYDGYWLFGFLVTDLDELKIDLLGQETNDPTNPIGFAISSAVAKFDEQRQKSGLARSHIRDACLSIKRLPETNFGWQNNHWSAGFKVRFEAAAVTDSGKSYRCERVVFVAPHNPEFESRRWEFT